MSLIHESHFLPIFFNYGLRISTFLVNAVKKRQTVPSLILFWSAAQTYMIVPTVLAAVPCNIEVPEAAAKHVVELKNIFYDML